MHVILFFLSLFLILFGLKRIWDFSYIKRWSRIACQVVSYEIRQWEEKDLYGYFVYYAPSVIYKYEIDGIIYENDVLSPDIKATRYTEKKDADTLMNEILVRKEIYFNPDNPSESFLLWEIPERRFSHYISIVVSGVLVMITGVTLLAL